MFYLKMLSASYGKRVLILQQQKIYIALTGNASHLERFISCRESHQNYISNERKITLLE